MIDVNKNHVYIIEVRYWYRNGEDKLKLGSRTFTSMHSITSKKFEDWLAVKMKEVKNFEMYDDDYLSQYTVPKSDFCR